MSSLFAELGSERSHAFDQSRALWIVLRLRCFDLRWLEPWQSRRTDLVDNPVAQLLCRLAIDFVVSGDIVQDLLVAGFDPALVGDDAGAGRCDFAVSFWTIEGFEVLDGVAGLRGDEALLDDPVEIDEGLRSQKVIELRLADAVFQGEALESGHLVVIVVVDVRARVPTNVIGEIRQDRFGRRALLVLVVSPPRFKLRRAGNLGVDAEQVFEAAVDERVAFHVEEEVGCVWLGQSGKSSPLFDRQQFV